MCADPARFCDFTEAVLGYPPQVEKSRNLPKVRRYQQQSLTDGSSLKMTDSSNGSFIAWVTTESHDRFRRVPNHATAAQHLCQGLNGCVAATCRHALPLLLGFASRKARIVDMSCSKS